MEVAKPVSFSVLVIAVILVPLFSLQGVEGKMFAPLAGTMLIALLVSLVVALTVIPVLSDAVLPRSPEKEFRFIRRLHDGYVRLLDHFLAYPKRALLTSLGLLLVAGALVPFVGTEFMPPLDEGAIAINVVRLAERLHRRLGEGGGPHREDAPPVPGGGDGGVEDRPGGDLARTPWAPSRPTCSSC